MANVSNLAPFILKWEGGFANDPDDKGRETMKGVTISTFQTYRRSIGASIPTVNDLKNISDSEWTLILKKYYWDAWQSDRIVDQCVANILVDWTWGSGGAIKNFQSNCGLTVDGIVGEKTLAYINRQEPTVLFVKVIALRKAYYDAIVRNDSSQSKFLQGWYNRLYDNMNYNYKSAW